MVRGDLLMGLRPMAPEGDRFDPDRVGLDHLSFSAASRDDLEQAVRLFDEQGVPHGTITRLPSFGIDVLPFEDPTAFSWKLTAPVDQPAPQGWLPCRYPGVLLAISRMRRIGCRVLIACRCFRQ